MELKNAKVFNSDSELKVVLPLTRPTGKVRVKIRSSFDKYGDPVAVRRTALGPSNYVEWQIGYDLEAKAKNRSRTSLRGSKFENYKGVRKYAYELSEILFYSYEHGWVTAAEIKATYDKIQGVQDERTFEKRKDMRIRRSRPVASTVDEMGFYKMTVKYPMLVYKFGRSGILAEVVIKEKQRAVGTQAMLYVCLPITSLRFKRPALGRILDAKETGEWVIGREEGLLSLELFRVFGLLSPKHRFDVLAIFKMLFPRFV